MLSLNQTWNLNSQIYLHLKWNSSQPSLNCFSLVIWHIFRTLCHWFVCCTKHTKIVARISHFIFYGFKLCTYLFSVRSQLPVSVYSIVDLCGYMRSHYHKNRRNQFKNVIWSRILRCAPFFMKNKCKGRRIKKKTNKIIYIESNG